MSTELNTELAATLQHIWADALKSAPRQNPDRTPECPPLSRFAIAQRTGWTAEEEAHRAACRYCQMTWGFMSEDDSAASVNDGHSASAPVSRPAAEPVVRVLGASREFSMRAGASCASAGQGTPPISLPDGWNLSLFPKPGGDLMTVRLDGNPISGTIELLLNDQPVALVKPFDEFGYGAVTQQVAHELETRRDQIKLRVTH